MQKDRPDKEGMERNDFIQASLEHNKKMEGYLEENASQIYVDGQRSSKCTRHPGGNCLVRFEDSRPVRERPVTIGTLTPPCLPFTRGGARLGEAHESLPSYLTSITEHAEGKFDASFMETAVDMPPTVFTEIMIQKTEPVWAKFGPEDLGVPVSRPRFLGVNMGMEVLSTFPQLI